MTDLAPILQGFFRVKLLQHKNASPHTIGSYRDAWRLLLHYAQQATGTAPARMRLGQLDEELITGFLQHLETERHCSARTRNNRLAAIHSLFRYAQLHALDDAEVIRRVLAIEGARTDDREFDWLTPDQATAVLAAPDRSRWIGQRDYTMMTILLATGFRISELLTLVRADVHLQPAGPYLHCVGKGRKDRCTPLDPATAAVVQDWLDAGNGQDPLFPAQGHTAQRPLTRDGFQARLTAYRQQALARHPSLSDTTLTPHVFRHTKAMNMRAAGHDISIIALWLGHEDISSTTKYLHADMKLKERTLELTVPANDQRGRFEPTDTVLDFLDNLTRRARGTT
jgi:site-specific recombinase XerD